MENDTTKALTPTAVPSQVSQGDATEKLAHQVAAQVAAADRRVEEASGDPHEEEKDEAHKSSKGHVSGKYGLCVARAANLGAGWPGSEQAAPPGGETPESNQPFAQRRLARCTLLSGLFPAFSF